MNPTKIVSAYFSPNGRTALLANTIAESLLSSFATQQVSAAEPCDFTSPALETYDFTTPASREISYSFGQGDLLTIAFPTYAGKLPNKILPFLKENVHGDGTPAIAIVSFGNRSFDNSLAELCRVLSDNGFVICGAAAFPTQHAFSDKLATGRPSSSDLDEAASFARTIAALISASPEACRLNPISLSDIPGDADAPYYTPLGIDNMPAKFLKAKPSTDSELCDNCTLCIKLCPMGAINPEDPADIPGTCIKCHACINLCPQKAKSMTDEAFLSHRKMLEASYTRPLSPTFFYPIP